MTTIRKIRKYGWCGIAGRDESNIYMGEMDLIDTRYVSTFIKEIILWQRASKKLIGIIDNFNDNANDRLIIATQANDEQIEVKLWNHGTTSTLLTLEIIGSMKKVVTRADFIIIIYTFGSIYKLPGSYMGR